MNGGMVHTNPKQKQWYKTRLVFPFILLKPFLEDIDTLEQFWARTNLLTLNWEEEVVTLESMVTIEIKEIEMGEADVVRFGGERSWQKVSVTCKLTPS